MCLLNAPGTFHASTMANYGIYEGMEKLFNETGKKVMVGSVFNLGSHDFLVKSSQKDPIDFHALMINREATLVCQLSEWGMHMIK